MKIACVGYREWALNLFEELHYSYDSKFSKIFSKNKDHNLFFILPKENTEVSEASGCLCYDKKIIWIENPRLDISAALEQLKPDIVLFYGWSWIIPKEIIEKYVCICLHPSPLPRYRGGSPIQNQIIAGEKKSAVTLFRMTQKLDAGPIYDQKEFSLEGELQEILGVVKGLGFHMTVKLLNNWPVEPKEQNGSLATYCKRRTPEQSEITLEELKNESAETLYNKIRSLQTPYPRPYIVCGNGKKLYITGAIIDEY